MLTIFSNVLVCVNSSTNFVIYSIFGKKFRAKLKEAFSCNVRVNRHEMQRNNTLMSAAPTALSGVHATVGPTPTAGSSGVVTLPVRNVDKRSPSSPNVITPDLHRSANHVTSRVCRTSITRPLLARLRCASLDSCGDSLAKHSTHFELRHSFIDHQQQSSSKPTDDQNETRRTRSDHRSSVLDMTHLENDHFEMGADSSSSTITTERTSHLHCKDENGFGNKAIVRHSDNIVSQHHQHHSADSNCIDEATRHNLNNNNTLPFADEYVINCNLCAQKCKERVQKETFV